MRTPCLFVLFGCIILFLILPPVCATTPEAQAQWKIAFNLFAAKKCPSALAASEKAIALDPQFCKPWNVKGCALACLGRNQEALDAFDKAIALDPTLDIAKKNKDSVQLAIQKGAPLTTPPVILPEIRNQSIPHDGELGTAPVGILTGCDALIQTGHAVYFQNNRTITVTGVRVAGCRYGQNEGNVRVEIWDKDLRTLSSDTIPYDQIPFPAVKTGGPTCIGNSSWVDIGLPDHEVTGDFSIAIFTGSFPLSADGDGIFIDYTTPSETGTSYAVATRPNRIDYSTRNPVGGIYNTTELDWMIRVLYKTTPAPAGITLSPGNAGTEQGAGPANPSQGTGTPAAAAPVPTKSPTAEGLAVIGLVVCMLCRKSRA